MPHNLRLVEMLPVTHRNSSWLCCDKYFYIYPEPKDWYKYDDIDECREKTGLEPRYLPAELLTELKKLVGQGRAEEASVELVAAMLRGEA